MAENGNGKKFSWPWFTLVLTGLGIAIAANYAWDFQAHNAIASCLNEGDRKEIREEIKENRQLIIQVLREVKRGQ